jgi:hypothetical protein
MNEPYITPQHQCLIDALEAIDGNCEKAKELLDNYRNWRAKGGTEPQITINGDKIAQFATKWCDYWLSPAKRYEN